MQMEKMHLDLPTSVTGQVLHHQSNGAGAASTDIDAQCLSPSGKSSRASRHQRHHYQIGGFMSPGASGSSQRQASKGKRKAAAEHGTAQQAQQAQHVLKRKERGQACPMCCAAQMMGCDKLDSLPLAQLKLVMG